jgi:GntR family transcriptional regulator
MDIVLNRRGGVPVRDQLVKQLELKILAGAFTPGQRLPSVRALARRLKVHHNTVSAAYRDLEAAGQVETRRGSGVFVKPNAVGEIHEARGLDEMIRMALHTALSRGFSGVEIRAAVERWLAAVPPERVVVVDPSPEMAGLIAHEIRGWVPVPVASCTPEDVARDARLLSGALAVALPNHVESLRRQAPSAAVRALSLRVAEADRRAIVDVAPGSILLVVTRVPVIVPFASVFIRSLRGDEVFAEARLLSDSSEWRRLVKVADLVLADALSAEDVRRERPRAVREIRMIPEDVRKGLEEALTVVVPRVETG